MTREFNKNQQYGSRPPYRGSPSNNRHGAEQPSEPTGPVRPRLNRAMVDRAWETGAPHRHADYKPRNPNEAGRTQSNYGSNSQRNWRKPQSSEHPANNDSFHERSNGARPPRYDSRDPRGSYTQPQRPDSPSNGYQGSRPRSVQPNNSFADRPPYRDQRGNGNEENTYRARNGHPNFNQTPPPNRGRYNQESGDHQGPSNNGAYSYRTPPTNRAHNVDRTDSYRDQRGRSYNQREAPPRNNRFEGGRQRSDEERPEDFNKPRYPTYPATSGKPRENRNPRPAEQFKGDYEQFDHAPAPSRPPRDVKRSEQLGNRAPQPYTKKKAKPVEVEHHVTQMPDGRVLKGPRPAQRKNAQFWSGISQDAEKLVNVVQTPEETPDTLTDKTSHATIDGAVENVVDGQTPTTDAPVEPRTSTTRAISTRAQAAKRAAKISRNSKDRSLSKGPRPSQRGFKWPTSPTEGSPTEE